VAVPVVQRDDVNMFTATEIASWYNY